MTSSGIKYQTAQNGSVFGIEVSRESQLPTTQHKLPEGRVLVLTSNHGPGYKSAHRALAKSLGWTRKEHEHHHMNAKGALVVHTYWLPPVGTSTSELPEV